MKTIPSVSLLALTCALVSATAGSLAAEEAEVPVRPVVTERAVVMPAYPDALREVGREGHAFVLCQVTPEGVVRSYEVIAATSPAITREIGKVVPDWKFAAEYPDGNPRDYEVLVPFRFELRGPGMDSFEPGDLLPVDALAVSTP